MDLAGKQPTYENRCQELERMKKEEKKRKSQPFIGIQWDCCKTYSRVYLNNKGAAYVGWCPKCSKRVQINVCPGGSKSRFFNVG